MGDERPEPPYIESIVLWEMLHTDSGDLRLDAIRLHYRDDQIVIEAIDEIDDLRRQLAEERAKMREMRGALLSARTYLSLRNMSGMNSAYAIVCKTLDECGEKGGGDG